MGRTIHYDVFGPLEIERELPAIRQTADLAQRMIDHHFFWGCEDLSLEIQDHAALTYARRPPKPWGALVGTGFTKVAGDELNAAFVVAYFEWFSRTYPATTVRVSDEGDFIRPHMIVIRGGEISLDAGGVKQQEAYLRSRGLDADLERLGEVVARAKRGDFFTRYPASDYADRREIQALRLTDDELREMDVRAVTDRLVFPWDTEWLDRG